MDVKKARNELVAPISLSTSGAGDRDEAAVPARRVPGRGEEGARVQPAAHRRGVEGGPRGHHESDELLRDLRVLLPAAHRDGASGLLRVFGAEACGSAPSPR